MKRATPKDTNVADQFDLAANAVAQARGIVGTIENGMDADSDVALALFAAHNLLDEAEKAIVRLRAA
jgi:hypothetical protein